MKTGLEIGPGLATVAWYRLQFLPNHFQTSHVSFGWWEEEPYWFWVTGSTVKVNFSTLCIKPFRHNTDCSFCPITSKLHMKVVDGEKRNSIDLGHGIKGQGQLWHSAYWTLWAWYSFCKITFKLHRQVVEDERRNPIDFGSWGQRSRSTLALCV